MPPFCQQIEAQHFIHHRFYCPSIIYFGFFRIRLISMIPLYRKTFFSAVFFVLFALNGDAQLRDSLLGVYNSQTIHSLGKGYAKGSRQLSFFDLKPEFSSTVTKVLYKKSKSNLVLSRFLTVASIAALVTSAVVRKNNKGAAVALSVGGIGLNLSSIRLRKQSVELLERALWMRNKEVLFGPQ